MLFLVISNPAPAKPNEVKAARLDFRKWIFGLHAQNKVLSFYPRVGRGSVITFDVSSNDELHRLLTEWSNIMPATFEIYPLASASEAENLLQ